MDADRAGGEEKLERGDWRGAMNRTRVEWPRGWIGRDASRGRVAMAAEASGFASPISSQQIRNIQEPVSTFKKRVKSSTVCETAFAYALNSSGIDISHPDLSSLTTISTVSSPF